MVLIVIGLIRRMRPRDTEGRKNGYFLVVVEELLFWGGLGTLAFGSGWVAVAGGVAIIASIVLVAFLWAHS